MDEERAPKDILNNGKTDGVGKKGAQAAATAANSKKGSSGKASEQRYFRVPFVRPNEQNRDTNGEQKKKGWWYAHFDGKIIHLFYFYG